MTLAALRNDATIGRTLTLAGPKAWTVPEVISLCEKFADERANVTEVRPPFARGVELVVSMDMQRTHLCIVSSRSQ